MHFGEYERTVDYKGRLSIPGHLLAPGDDVDWGKAVLLKADPPCLYMYDHLSWKMLLQAAYNNMDDDEGRLFMHRALSDASTIEIDNLKRVTIPTALLAHASIEKRVVVVGMFNRLELWEPDAWQSHIKSLEDVQLPSLEDLSRIRIREVS